MTTNKIEKLNEKTNVRVYINHVFGKNVNAFIGPVYDGKFRAIFCQASKGGRFWETGSVNIETGEIVASGEQNCADTAKVLAAL